MTKATEDRLSALHGLLAETYIQHLSQADEATMLLVRHEDVELPDDIVSFLERHSTVSPAVLTSITKFLKDNEITCDPSESEGVTELEKRLADKRNNVTAIPIN